ncbi:SDR family NAD(P)-dependent oxidoreductase [Flavobacterium sp.]|jgi:nucleoside-diphosphate-sugar epimerase|uniref:SDR family NAD(P)-dependent oxidoreductase n=1 Tax=Flavobacterium sp. TaxID=239 RepID=UPI0037BE24FE
MKVSILGCGWLGFPLAKKLIEIGFEVKGSTTSENKLAVLKSNKIAPYLLELSETKISECISDFLYNSDILIIDIPPGLRKITEATSEKTFVAKIEHLIPFIENSTVKKVIFISSTSVYADTSPISTVTEESILHPDSESGKQLVEVENLLRNNSNFQTTIIRFGGLIGEERNIVKMLTGKTNVANPDAPINLIHQQDCIEIICEILKQNCWNETFNAVAPNHPTRKNYYTEKAKQFHLTAPLFNENETNFGKIVSSEKLETILGYRFRKFEL